MSPSRIVVHWLSAILSSAVREPGKATTQVGQSYAALQESEKRLQAMFDQAAVGVALVNVETGCFERVNQRYCDILGYTREELLGREVDSLPDETGYQANKALLDQLKRGEVTSFHIEKRQRRKDGAVVWIDLTVAPVLYDGEGPKYNVGIVQDITDRRQMEDALRGSEERLRSILDHLPVGILLFGQDERIIFRNRNFIHITGYTERGMKDMAAWWRLAYPDAQMRAHTQARWKSLREQAHGGQVARGEYEICCADGAFRSVAISGVQLGLSEIFIFEDLSQYKAAEEQINYLAYYDPLTGLANRRFLIDHLGMALARSARRKRCGALLMLGIDRFKTLNEVRGYDCGDQLLRQVAQRLRGFVREDDRLARYGGDTFVLLLDASSCSLDGAAAYASDVGERVLVALRIPFMIDGEPYHGTASIGGAVFEGRLESGEKLLQQIDMAMYRAKALGRDTMRFYDSQVQAQVRARATLESDLRIALAQSQFELYYQPQVREEGVVGAEALVRWHHPRDGLIPPARFIPLAEETGLIVPFGAWVLRAACQQLAIWANRPHLSALTLAVNISPLEFGRDDFVEQVLSVLASTGANPYQLELELTEGMLLRDVEGTVAKMEQLKAHGVSFVLDDFGTGYSSLSYLKRLPLDKLKIDQSFVRDVLVDPNDAAIVRTIVALGTTLGLRVIAEGVETEVQRDFLQDHGCIIWQGYLFGKPVPAVQFEALVRS